MKSVIFLTVDISDLQPALPLSYIANWNSSVLQYLVEDLLKFHNLFNEIDEFSVILTFSSSFELHDFS